MKISIPELTELAIRVDALEAALTATNHPSAYLDVKRSADYTGLSQHAIRSAERRGDLKGHRPYGRSKGGRLLLARSELDRFVRGDAP